MWGVNSPGVKISYRANIIDAAETGLRREDSFIARPPQGIVVPGDVRAGIYAGKRPRPPLFLCAEDHVIQSGRYALTV
jgi:hypothetical protein